MELLIILTDITETFYSSMGALTTWLQTDIEIPGIITASPLEMLTSWVSLSILVLAILIKKLVPVA